MIPRQEGWLLGKESADDQLDLADEQKIPRGMFHTCPSFERSSQWPKRLAVLEELQVFTETTREELM